MLHESISDEQSLWGHRSTLIMIYICAPLYMSAYNCKAINQRVTFIHLRMWSILALTEVSLKVFLAVLCLCYSRCPKEDVLCPFTKS